MSCKRWGYRWLQMENHTALIISRHSAQEKELLYRQRLNCVQEQSTETDNLWRKILKETHICSKCYLQNNSFHECLHAINAFHITFLQHPCQLRRPYLHSLISCPTQPSSIMKRSTLWNRLFKITLLSIKCQEEIWKWSLLHIRVTS